jgi:Rha family phage regulatory protein
MNNLVEIKNNQIVTTSRQVAESFGKRHSDVIRAIEDKLANAKLRSLFYESEYTDSQGKKRKEYLMNRDGFSFIVMGFTGDEATDWKLKYIEAFNAMEKAIKTPQLTPNPKYRTRMISTAVRDVEKTKEAIMKMFKVKDGIAYTKAMALIEPAYGIDLTPIKPLVPAATHETGYINPTEIGKQLGGVKPQEVNLMLENMHFQHREGKSWRLDKAGEDYGEEIPYTRNGHSGYQIRWNANVVSALQIGA